MLNDQYSIASKIQKQQQDAPTRTSNESQQWCDESYLISTVDNQQELPANQSMSWSIQFWLQFLDPFAYCTQISTIFFEGIMNAVVQTLLKLPNWLAFSGIDRCFRTCFFGSNHPPKKAEHLWSSSNFAVMCGSDGRNSTRGLSPEEFPAAGKTTARDRFVKSLSVNGNDQRIFLCILCMGLRGWPAQFRRGDHIQFDKSGGADFGASNYQAAN